MFRRFKFVLSGNHARFCAAVGAGSGLPAAPTQGWFTLLTVPLIRQNAGASLAAELSSATNTVIRAAFAIDSLVVSTAGVAVIVGGADVVAERTAATINRTPTVVVDEAAVGLTLRWEAGRARGLGLAAGAHEF
jgi:hypothetical protein